MVLSDLTPRLFKRRDTANTVMLNVFIAALPAVCWSVYVFGLRCLTLYATAVVSAFVCQIVSDVIIKRSSFRFDTSSVVTGILVAMALPVGVPLWLPAFAAAFGIIVGKALFGGTGKNIFNPAALGICASYLLFAEKMTVFTKPFVSFSPTAVDVTGELLESSRTVTSLDLIRSGVTDTSVITDEFYGLTPGGIGTVSSLLLIIGLAYLLLTRTVHFNSTLAFVLIYMLASVLLCYVDYEPSQFMELQLFTGPLIFVLTFMLNDYITTPTTSLGRIVFAVFAAAGIFAVRQFGMVHYGEYFVVLILNVFTPFIDKKTYPVVFGSKVRGSL